LRKCQRKTFNKKYFSEFFYKEFDHGHELFKEGDEVDNLYLLKEGEIDISCHKSVLGLNTFVNDLIELNKNNKVFADLKNEEYNMITNPNIIKEELMHKREIRVLNLIIYIFSHFLHI